MSVGRAGLAQLSGPAAEPAGTSRPRAHPCAVDRAAAGPHGGTMGSAEHRSALVQGQESAQTDRVSESGSGATMADDDEERFLQGLRFRNTRFDPELSPFQGLAKQMAAGFGYSAVLSVDPRLAQLLRLRVAQLNPCSYCLILHTQVAHRIGIPPDVVAHLPSWRESTMFSAAEQAALAYCEALTRFDHVGFSELHEQLRSHYDESQV